MIAQQVDDRVLIARLSETERRRMPRAVLVALNDSAFAVRGAWGTETLRVFDRPEPITQRAALVKKATPDNLQAEVFIRNEAFKGTPPSRYLISQVQGGPREQKPFERNLQSNPRARKFYVPGKGIESQLDRYGNVPARVISKILSQLQARRDPAQNETSVSRARRLRKQARKGGGGSYFILAKRRGKLRPGVIYERINAAGAVGKRGNGTRASGVRSVLVGTDTAPTYRKRYNVFKLAQDMFAREYRIRFGRVLQGLGRR